MKRYRLKKQWKILLAILVLMPILVTFIKYTNKAHIDWYNECDQALGYTTDYYTCRQYHLHK